MTINNLTPLQLQNMQKDFSLDSQDPNNPPRYYGMYGYIWDKLHIQMDTEQAYWFEQAAEINQYLNAVAIPEHERSAEEAKLAANPSQSAYFIEQINIESLKAAGKPFTEENIARISKRKVS